MAKVKLSREEQRLILWPPTETTWYCKTCNAANAGSRLQCGLCTARRPKSPKMAWPVYQAALAKKELMEQ